MLIRNEQLSTEVADDEVHVTISFDVHFLDSDVERHSGIREVVALRPPPGGSYYVHDGFLPDHLAVRPNPASAWKELHRTHKFTVPRHQGFQPVRFRGYIKVTPPQEYTDEKYTTEGVVPANFSATPVTGTLSSWFSSLVSKLTKRPGG